MRYIVASLDALRRVLVELTTTEKRAGQVDSSVQVARLAETLRSPGFGRQLLAAGGGGCS
jgi:hypothetical protein